MVGELLENEVTHEEGEDCQCRRGWLTGPRAVVRPSCERVILDVKWVMRGGVSFSVGGAENKDHRGWFE